MNTANTGFPASKAEAIACGFNEYLTNRPCRRGHVDFRYLNGDCISCAKARAQFNSEKMAAYNREYYAANSEKLAAYKREYYVANSEKLAVQHREYYVVNSEKLRAKQREYREANPGRVAACQREYRKANVKTAAAYHREWRRANPDKMNAVRATRRAMKLGATPSWLTKSQRDAINVFYAKAQGGGYVVDHIMPLQGKTVCGLHVPWNLQLMSHEANSEKGNRLPPLNQRIDFSAPGYVGTKLGVTSRPGAATTLT